jgi:hypothetical protein
MDEGSKELLKHIQGFIKDSVPDVTNQLIGHSDTIERYVDLLCHEVNSWRPCLESQVDVIQAVIVGFIVKIVGPNRLCIGFLSAAHVRPDIPACCSSGPSVQAQ